MCLVSSARLFAHQPLTAHDVATDTTRLCVLSPTDFESALSDSGFRNGVLGLFASRMADLTALIEAVAFQRLDSRLAATLPGNRCPGLHRRRALADRPDRLVPALRHPGL
jgi:CRP/FNR family transcriptional regulator, anaerobic regulatory protein